ncbi:Ubiquinone/menaquinone biosynthesis C-methyltransferase UbiE [Candidatus Bilamarchaeum dharawalense]|uniref:Ubiquinone/menaquinone biosynthesis C-methyltransferase UbiE n=1 Tax=Candidatus Bilamarchaeum dharawalense TaxID=2885759 RepID=A0A5E4LP20_9ARCH|nr:Ubiquinone/menaquinone biosynthesis C-methyltransferase UbiE [Candidatus Bilamarchaeum dharawalense]
MKDYYKNHAEWYDILSPGTDEDVKFYLKEAKKTKGKVLEIACGTGRIYLELLKAGVDVYGLDTSPAMLRVLNEKSKTEKLHPKVKLADMRSFKYPFKFDLVIIPFRAFLHMETREDQKKCLKCIGQHMEKGGRLVLNFFDPKLEILLKAWHKKGTIVSKKHKIKLDYTQDSEYDLINQRISARYHLENKSKGVSVEIPFSLCYLFPREFMNMLELCGFEKWELYGGFDRRPYNKNGQELIWIVHR